MKSSCISLVMIIIEGGNEHSSVIFPTSKDIIFCNSAWESSKGAKNMQVLHGNWVIAACSPGQGFGLSGIGGGELPPARAVSFHGKHLSPVRPSVTAPAASITTAWASGALGPWHPFHPLKASHWEICLSKSTSYWVHQLFPHPCFKIKYFRALNINSRWRFYPKPPGHSFTRPQALRSFLSTCKLESPPFAGLAGEPDEASGEREQLFSAGQWKLPLKSVSTPPSRIGGTEQQQQQSEWPLAKLVSGTGFPANAKP